MRAADLVTKPNTVTDREIDGMTIYPTLIDEKFSPIP